jgi:hypothetical protein
MAAFAESLAASDGRKKDCPKIKMRAILDIGSMVEPDSLPRRRLVADCRRHEHNSRGRQWFLYRDWRGSVC